MTALRTSNWEGEANICAMFVFFPAADVPSRSGPMPTWVRDTGVPRPAKRWVSEQIEADQQLLEWAGRQDDTGEQPAKA